MLNFLISTHWSYHFWVNLSLLNTVTPGQNIPDLIIRFTFRYEDEKNIEEAIRLYQKCLGIAPHHQEARSSLQLLSKGRQRPNFSIDFLDIGNNVTKVDESKVNNWIINGIELVPSTSLLEPNVPSLFKLRKRLLV